MRTAKSDFTLSHVHNHHHSSITGNLAASSTNLIFVIEARDFDIDLQSPMSKVVAISEWSPSFSHISIIIFATAYNYLPLSG